MPELRSYEMDAASTLDGIGLAREEFDAAVGPIFTVVTAPGNTTRAEEVKVVEEHVRNLNSRQVAAALHFFAEGYVRGLAKQRLVETLLEEIGQDEAE